MAITSLSNPRFEIWWVFLLQGLAAVVLGIMLLTNPGATLTALVMVMGSYWLVTGLLSLVRIFVDRSVPWGWSLAIGIIGILAGVLMLNHPLLAALSFPALIALILGIQGVTMGVIEIFHAFGGGGLGSFIVGAINIVLGLMLLAAPIEAAMVIPVVFGFVLILQGLLVAFWAIRVHQLVRETDPDRAAAI